MKLFRVGDTTWWIMVDTAKQEIISQHEKKQTEATIAALEATIAAQPSLTVMQQDFTDLVNIVQAQNIPKARKDRVVAMLYAMYDSHAQSQSIRDAIEQRDRLVELKALLAQMEA